MTSYSPADNGGRPASPLLHRAVELLEDGEWHDYDEILRLVGRAVPPGKAMRKNERLRTGHRHSHGETYEPPAERVQQRPPERLIESGQRAYARNTLKMRRYFQVDPLTTGGRLDTPKRVRMIAVPSSVLADRERGRVPVVRRDAGELVEILRAADDVERVLGELTREELESVAALLLVST